MKLNDLNGKTFGNWQVLYRNGSTANKAAIWRCKCTLCGAEHDVAGYTLTSGASTKCRSCVPKVTLSKPNRHTRLYHIYTGMKQRCTNRKHSHYDRYKAVTICDEWMNNPDSFIQWALSNGYKDDLTLDRIDNSKGYSPDNCRWTSYQVQSFNRSNVIKIMYDKNIYSLNSACKIAGVNRSKVRTYKSKENVSYQEAFDHYIKKTD